ncbi:MAG TPA: hypothetical protein VFS17_01390, partial [Methylophilaceae bacterium]|nr:hypothetical protein [Methylophilaceae bacterium]
LVIDAARQVEGEHADKVHGPDARTHHERGDSRPRELAAAMGGAGDSMGYVECGVGSENRDENRDNNKDRVIRPKIKPVRGWNAAQELNFALPLFFLFLFLCPA